MKLDKIRFAQVLCYIGRQFAINMSDSEVKMLDELINFPQAKAQYAPCEAVDELLRQIANPDGFIPAIKAYRSLTGQGLKEAKEAVERFRVIPKFRDSEPATLGDILGHANKS